MSFGGTKAQSLETAAVAPIKIREQEKSIMPMIQAGLRNFQRAAVFVAAGLALASSANASFTVTTAQRIACTPDVFRLCSSEIPNVSHIIACMLAKKASLSPACRTVVDAALANRTASRE
jgi:hypothetical protein